MKLVRICGTGDDDDLLILAPATMSDEDIEQAVAQEVAVLMASKEEDDYGVYEMKDALVATHGFTLITGEYDTTCSWVDG